MTDQKMPTHSEAELAPHIATMNEQLNTLGTLFPDLIKRTKDSYTPIPYYKIALQSQRQFCQSLHTLKSILPKKSSSIEKAD